VQIRLQSEFEQLSSEGYSFDVKRGEEGGGDAISNEYAGKLLLAFDLDEPWSCHQTYKVFDEKYAEIFARPEVTAHRIIFLAKTMGLVERHVTEIKNASLGHYGLTKYTVLATIKKLLNSDALGKRLCKSPVLAFKEKRMECILKLIDDLLTSIVIDLNHEVGQGALSDYLHAKGGGKRRAGIARFVEQIAICRASDNLR
jgi:hypothetical protein